MLYDDLEVDQLYDVSCALPDLRYVLALALGVVVIAAALALWIVRRV